MKVTLTFPTWEDFAHEFGIDWNPIDREEYLREFERKAQLRGTNVNAALITASWNVNAPKV
jgi:hypothetical protein